MVKLAPKTYDSRGFSTNMGTVQKKACFWDGFPYLQKRGNPDCCKILFWFIVCTFSNSV